MNYVRSVKMVKRWDIDAYDGLPFELSDGPWVKYEDHVEDVANLQQKLYNLSESYARLELDNMALREWVEARQGDEDLCHAHEVKVVNQLYEDVEKLWDSINGKDSWESNPWVWVVEFEKEER
jgi:hypothetical protein